MAPRRSGGDQIANARKRRESERRGWRFATRCGGEQRLRGGDGDLAAREIVDLAIHVESLGDEVLRQARHIDHGRAHERQLPSPERVLDEARIDIDDAVAETVLGPGRTVMQFVGMQDMALAGQAMAPLAEIAEALHAEQRDADRIDVMAMREEGLPAEIGLGALDPLPSAPDVDAARASRGRAEFPAQRFKPAP